MHVFKAKRFCLYFFFFLGVCFFIKPAFAYNLFSFEGELDFLNKTFNLLSEKSKESFLELKIDQYSKTGYTIFLKFNHLKNSFFDLSSDVKVTVHSVLSEGTFEEIIQGKLSSQYSLFDYKPIEELSGAFEIKNHQIFLKSITFGKISCNGTIDTQPPFKVDLAFELDSIEMTSFLSFWTQKTDYDASGLVSGEIKVSGPFNEIFLQGKLVSYDGHVNQLEFNNLFLNIEGSYPEMNILESLVSQTEGMSFVFQGPMDLREVSSQRDFTKQVKALTISPLVKDSHSQVEWTLKSTNQKDMGKMELKYLLRKDKDSNALNREGSDMFGIENTIEF